MSHKLLLFRKWSISWRSLVFKLWNFDSKRLQLSCRCPGYTFALRRQPLRTGFVEMLGWLQFSSPGILKKLLSARLRKYQQVATKTFSGCPMYRTHTTDRLSLLFLWITVCIILDFLTYQFYGANQACSSLREMLFDLEFGRPWLLRHDVAPGS